MSLCPEESWKQVWDQDEFRPHSQLRRELSSTSAVCRLRLLYVCVCVCACVCVRVHVCVCMCVCRLGFQSKVQVSCGKEIR